jgi:hypothetical protein
MAAEPRAWYLFDPEGHLLAHGRPRCDERVAADLLTLTLSRPGRLLQRCLLGGSRDLWLQPPSGDLLPVHVERLFFDPRAGRICVLRLKASSLPARSS